MNCLFVRVMVSKFVNTLNPEQGIVGAKEWLQIPYDGSQTIQDLVHIIKKKFQISGEIILSSTEGYRMEGNINLRILSQMNMNETIVVLPGRRNMIHMGTQTEAESHRNAAQMGTQTEEEGPSSPSVCGNITDMKNEKTENMDDGNQGQDIDERSNEEEFNNTKDADNDSGLSDSGEDDEMAGPEVSKIDVDIDVEPENVVADVLPDENQTMNENYTNTAAELADVRIDLLDTSLSEKSLIATEEKDTNAMPTNKRKISFSEDSVKGSPPKKLASISSPELPSPTPAEIGSSPSDFDLSSDSVANKSSIEMESQLHQASPAGGRKYFTRSAFKRPFTIPLRSFSRQNKTPSKEPSGDSVSKTPFTGRRTVSLPETRSADGPLTPFFKTSTPTKDANGEEGRFPPMAMCPTPLEQNGWRQVTFEDLKNKDIGSEVICQYLKKDEGNEKGTSTQCKMLTTKIQEEIVEGISSVNQEKDGKNLKIELFSISKEEVDKGEKKVFVPRDGSICSDMNKTN